MSVSTRTVQQPLGIGQIGGALAAIGLAVVMALAVAFGSLGVSKPAVTAPAAGAPPAVIDHGWSGAIAKPAAGAPPAAIDHGSSEGSMVITDTRGGFNGDTGLAPRSNEYAGSSSGDIDAVDHGARDERGTGTRVPGLRPQ